MRDSARAAFGSEGVRVNGQAGVLRRLVMAAVVAATLFAVGPATAGAATGFKYNPVLFVHGIEGSGAQFESQEMRFMSNGYPADWFDEVDYNSTRAVGDKSEVDQQIDDAIAALKQRPASLRSTSWRTPSAPRSCTTT